VGGDGSAPSPGWYLRAAEAACVATLIGMRGVGGWRGHWRGRGRRDQRVG
jgi:hypothetical protein